eukprot:2496090-Pyramimonas_sp.AAC.1
MMPRGTPKKNWGAAHHEPPATGVTPAGCHRISEVLEVGAQRNCFHYLIILNSTVVLGARVCTACGVCESRAARSTLQPPAPLRFATPRDRLDRARADCSDRGKDPQ